MGNFLLSVSEKGQFGETILLLEIESVFFLSKILRIV